MNRLLPTSLSTALAATLSLGLLSNLACQKSELNKTEIQSPAPAPATPGDSTGPKNPSLKEAACEISKKSHNRNEAQYVVQTQTVSIERHYQRVVRISCDGKQISDKIETVKSPRKDVRLEIPVKTPFQSVFVFSETTCDHKLSAMPAGNTLAERIATNAFYNVTGDGQKQITIKGDVANALLTFELAPGLNNIYVDFHKDCAPNTVSHNNNARVGQATCTESTNVLKALYPIDVKYKEVTLDGKMEIKQDEKGGSCAASEKKS